MREGKPSSRCIQKFFSLLYTVLLEIFILWYSKLWYKFYYLQLNQLWRLLGKVFKIICKASHNINGVELELKSFDHEYNYFFFNEVFEIYIMVLSFHFKKFEIRISERSHHTRFPLNQNSLHPNNDSFKSLHRFFITSQSVFGKIYWSPQNSWMMISKRYIKSYGVRFW